MRYAMIMAGGAGTRLWPMSRADRPKQLLPLIKKAGASEGKVRSLLEVAADRLEGVVPPERRSICTAERFRGIIRESLPQFSDAQILGEPAARDTVNAVGFAAAILHKQDKDAVFAVLTADQLIEPEDVFRQRMDLGFRLVEDDPTRLVTFSIKPTFPSTLYGYVERGRPITDLSNATHNGKPLAYTVARFVEKPPQHLAQAYVESGDFYWNSGMFVFHAGTFMECLKRFKPESHQGLTKIAEAWGTKKQELTLQAVYPALPRISVDYAVMEPASRDEQVSVCTVLADVRWLDVGSWPAFGETVTPDADGNRSGAHAGDTLESGKPAAVYVDSRDNLVVSDQPGHTLALLGVRDMIVVHTAGATLVMPKGRAEELKKLHAVVDEKLK